MRVAIYNKTTGEIVKRVDCGAAMVQAQCGAGEEFFLNPPPDATHIKNGLPVAVPYVMPVDMALALLRAERNARIAACDWTQLPDAPADKAAWAAYRQALRDMPECCDPYNPVWPNPPV